MEKETDSPDTPEAGTSDTLTPHTPMGTDGIDPLTREPDPSDDPHPTLSIPLKYCTYEVWQDQRTVATVFPRGYICTGARPDTEQNRTEAESQGYTGYYRVWRSLVDHELLHNVCAEVMFDRRSLVMETESGIAYHPSWLRYEEEMIVLAYQYFINTGRQPALLLNYPQGVYEIWKAKYEPLIAGICPQGGEACAVKE